MPHLLWRSPALHGRHVAASPATGRASHAPATPAVVALWRPTTAIALRGPSASIARRPTIALWWAPWATALRRLPGCCHGRRLAPATCGLLLLLPAAPPASPWARLIGHPRGQVLWLLGSSPALLTHHVGRLKW